MQEKIRILIIEDSILDAELILAKLSEAKISVEHCIIDNARDMQRQLESQEWDVILSDYAMPAFNPFLALEIVRKFNPYIPLIVISGAIGEEKAAELIRSGCRDFIMKKNLNRIPSVVLREFEEAKLRKENRKIKSRLDLYHLLANKANDTMLFLDLAGNILETNTAASNLYGYSHEEFLAMNFRNLSLSNEKSMLLEQTQFDEEINKVFELVHYHKNHTPIRVEVSTTRTHLEGKSILLCIVKDVTAKRKAEEDLLYMSYHDLLTGLFNRRYFEKELKTLDTNENLPLSIIMGDINGLKMVNDSLGHNTGDEILKRTAEIMRSICEETDILCRLGGDEFVIILPKTDFQRAQNVIQKIVNQVANNRVSYFELSISLGYDTKETEEVSLSEILVNAENDMYRHKLYERSSMRSKTLDLILNTLFEKSSRELIHSKRVSEICQMLASKLNLNKDEIGQIRIAGLIHDIGKIGIDERILNKPSKLDENEMKQIKKHPEIGWRILSSVNEFSELSNYVIAHHEKWDGSGYPKGLKGTEIPVQARIIAIADAYEAMTSERCYQRGLSKNEAVMELKRCAGKQFDPEMVAAFLELVCADSLRFSME